MQRKSSILNSRFQQKRNGFAMIMAIFFMIIMGTLMMSMLETTAGTANKTTNDYLLEQAQLLAKSTVEVAILNVSGHDRGVAGTNCHLGDDIAYLVDGSPMFDITYTISYFGLGTGCTNLLPLAAGTIQTEESNGTMMIDVYVSDNTALNLSEPIRYHRRTLQKL